MKFHYHILFSRSQCSIGPLTTCLHLVLFYGASIFFQLYTCCQHFYSSFFPGVFVNLCGCLTVFVSWHWQCTVLEHFLCIFAECIAVGCNHQSDGAELRRYLVFLASPVMLKLSVQLTFLSESVASLRLVSPGAVTDGVTFFLRQKWRLFSHPTTNYRHHSQRPLHLLLSSWSIVQRSCKFKIHPRKIFRLSVIDRQLPRQVTSTLVTPMIRTKMSTVQTTSTLPPPPPPSPL